MTRITSTLTKATRATHLAAIARLTSPGVGLQFVLDNLREILGAPFETRELDLGSARKAVLGGLRHITRPLGKTS